MDGRDLMCILIWTSTPMELINVDYHQGHDCTCTACSCVCMLVLDFHLDSKRPTSAMIGKEVNKENNPVARFIGRD